MAVEPLPDPGSRCAEAAQTPEEDPAAQPQAAPSAPSPPSRLLAEAAPPAEIAGESTPYAEPDLEAPAPVLEPASRPPPLAQLPSLLGLTSWAKQLSPGEATSELCCFCFQVLCAHLESQPPPPFPSTADPGFKAPIFVTWYRPKRNGGSSLELRGCIGCLEPIVLQPGLSEYALKSSMQDRRFSPVKLDEVSSLTCKISILYQFEVCKDPYDWEVGVHGVLIAFSDSGGKAYSATYLPEVPHEHSMTREKAIRELVAKSGYTKPCDQELLKALVVKRYRTLVQSVGYADYLRVVGDTKESVTNPGPFLEVSPVVHAT